MQKVVAYLLERRDGMEWPEARAAEAKRIRAEVEKWLTSKGASLNGTPTGTFEPEDDSTGEFQMEEAVDGDRSWWYLRLQEDAKDGGRFLTTLSVTTHTAGVSVFLAMETGWTTSRIVPDTVAPKCPKVVRSLLALEGTWYHAAWPLRWSRLEIKGFDAGEALVAEIERPERSVPLVVVSKDQQGKTVLPELDDRLARDLAGLANVVVVDEDASWALTDVLGSAWCCYWGAVRVFWPHFSRKDDRFDHPLWTADVLRASAGQQNAARDRFRRRLRSLIFGAAARSVIRPRVIDEIRAAVSKRSLMALHGQATSLDEYRQLAEAYANENDALKAERTALNDQIDDLRRDAAKLEMDKQALQRHLDDAKSKPSSDAEVMKPDEGGGEPEPPRPAEVRFYKKVHSRPSHDVMVPRSDCGHNNWQNAHAAEKARKGIAKLEGDRSDWKTLQHCAECTGGGMWRVRW